MVFLLRALSYQVSESTSGRQRTAAAWYQLFLSNVSRSDERSSDELPCLRNGLGAGSHDGNFVEPRCRTTRPLASVCRRDNLYRAIVHPGDGADGWNPVRSKLFAFNLGDPAIDFDATGRRMVRHAVLGDRNEIAGHSAIQYVHADPVGGRGGVWFQCLDADRWDRPSSRFLFRIGRSHYNACSSRANSRRGGTSTNGTSDSRIDGTGTDDSTSHPQRIGNRRSPGRNYRRGCLASTSRRTGSRRWRRT